MSVTPLSVVVCATGRELGAWDLARFTWNCGGRGEEKRKGEGEGVRERERVERESGGIFGICFVSYYNVDISHDTLNCEQ